MLSRYNGKPTAQQLTLSLLIVFLSYHQAHCAYNLFDPLISSGLQAAPSQSPSSSSFSSLSSVSSEQAPEYSEQQQQQQPQPEVPLLKSSLKKYLIRDVDPESYGSRAPIDKWKLSRLNQMLDVVGTTILTPTPSPVLFRSSRIYLGNPQSAGLPLLSSNFGGDLLSNQNQQDDPAQGTLTRQQFSSIVDSLENSGNSIFTNGRSKLTGSSKRPVVGIVWSSSTPANRQVGSMTQPPHYVNTQRKYSVNPNNKATAPKRYHKATGGEEEFPLQSPNLPPSDFEWKRVESSRWNNLRGMWGKRALNSYAGIGAANLENNQASPFEASQQQQQSNPTTAN